MIDVFGFRDRERGSESPFFQSKLPSDEEGGFLEAADGVEFTSDP
jgi:hypothetical protein